MAVERITGGLLQGLAYDEFDNIIFAEFASMPDRDKAINVINGAHATVGGKQVWAKPDQPFDNRAVESFLFGTKKQLMEWGYSKQQVWVDTSDASVSVDGAKVMRGNVSAGNLAFNGAIRSVQPGSCCRRGRSSRS